MYTTEKISEQWLITKVVPTPKRGDRKVVAKTNCQSLCIFKVFERLILLKINELEDVFLMSALLRRASF
jgi:hypothetical protein